MKQTAVEWLVDKLQKSKDWHRLLNEVSQMSTAKIDLINEAKEMEKKQIMDAYYQIGKDHQDMIFPIEKNAEQYYKETFKSE